MEEKFWLNSLDSLHFHKSYDTVINLFKIVTIKRMISQQILTHESTKLRRFNQINHLCIILKIEIIKDCLSSSNLAMHRYCDGCCDRRSD